MNLFKLTKDGKCVGYLELQKHHKPCEYLGLLWRYSKDGKTRWTGQKARWPAFDEAHPFVCTDKNGEKVFAGDEIEGNLFDRRIPTMGKIVYDSEHACYGNKNDAGITFLFKIADIELLKDKDNEVKNEPNSTTNPSPADTGA